MMNQELDMFEMGKRIRDRREFLKLTREQLAEKIDVSPLFVSDLEYGNKGMTLRRLFTLCRALDVWSDYILVGTYPKDYNEANVERIRDEIMVLLRSCNEKQLTGIRDIIWIYEENMK